MRKFCVLVLAGMLAGCGASQPTTIHGQAVSYWVQALQDHDTRARKKAVEVSATSVRRIRRPYRP
jgi:uncharacterized protein YcfL